MKQNSYGLKEVADVYFLPLKESATLTSDKYIGKISATYSTTDKKITITINDGTTTRTVVTDGSSADSATQIAPAYVFDSLKVSNIEVTSEETSATGGKGNPELISWSYGKAGTLTIEDALMSLDTFHLQFGSKEGETAENIVTIDANSFPGSYLIIGSTVIRSFATGNDEPFLFVISKGKPNVEGTLTMEADGDPTTFEMTIKALAANVMDASGNVQKDVLMRFIKVPAAQ